MIVVKGLKKELKSHLHWMGTRVEPQFSEVFDHILKVPLETHIGPHQFPFHVDPDLGRGLRRLDHMFEIHPCASGELA